jgi:hypothetical protein
MRFFISLVTLVSVSTAVLADGYDVPLNPIVCSTHIVKSVQKAGPSDVNNPSDSWRCGSCASSLSFKDGGWSMTPYRYNPELDSSKRGDVIRSCVISVRKSCPKGDDRGAVTVDTNMRTGGSWLSSDEHGCGGA